MAHISNGSGNQATYSDIGALARPELTGTDVDITEFRESEDRFLRLFQNSPMGIAVVAANQLFLRANASFCNLLGYTEEELVKLRANEVIDRTDRRSSAELDCRLLSRELPGYSIEEHLLRKDGTRVVVRKNCTAVWNTAGELINTVLTIEDITERRAAEDQLTYQANHDVLTGLPNRRLLEDRIQQAIAYAKRHKSSFGLFYIDLDSFKLINDSLGHAIGDVLLQQIAARLRRSVRESDTLARTGGDEFILIATDLRNAASAEKIAEKLRRTLIEPFPVCGHELFASISIGISMFPRDGKDAQALQQQADCAMYAAKRAGKNTVRLFQPAMGTAAIERLQMESQLRRALENREMSLVYQPQYSTSEHMLVGFEALLRWNPRSGAVPPLKFIPVAEETGLIIPIGKWVLEQACREIRRWIDAGFPPLRMAVNVSELQFAQPDFVRTVRQTLDRYHIDPTLLELELTESVVMRGFEAAAKKMAQLQELGVSIAIDDFGTGYSSLSYLRRLPVDAVKIDRSFVADTDRDAEAGPFLCALVLLCRSLNMRVVVEGIETPEQFAVVRSLDCDEAQGFLLGTPSAIISLETLNRTEWPGLPAFLLA